MLQLGSVCVRYGATVALNNVSLSLAEGAVGVVLGANGAGKTTLLRAISGTTAVESGAVTWRGKQIRRIPAHRRRSLGIAHVLEGHRVFTDQTVADNLSLAGHRVSRGSMGGEIGGSVEEALDQFPVLRQRLRQAAGTLSGGEQQQLAIAMALMSRPNLLLLDEPSLGLSPILVAEVFRLVKKLKAMGLTILLVEQAAEQALKLADYAWALRRGEIIAEGKPSEVFLGDSEIMRKVYLD